MNSGYGLEMPTRKRSQRSVRLPGDLEDQIQGLAEKLFSLGLIPEPNWTAALLLVLMQVKTRGWFDDPQAFLRETIDQDPAKPPKR